MQLAQVEGFLEVARRQNLSRAAEALFITQPALTARLRALEVEVGSALFRRGRRGMTLTEAGRAFLPYAERAVRALRDGTSAIERLPAAQELVLGAAPAISTYVLPQLLVRFEAAHPDVRLNVRTGHSEQMLELGVRGHLNLALVRELHHPGPRNAVPGTKNELRPGSSNPPHPVGPEPAHFDDLTACAQPPG